MTKEKAFEIIHGDGDLAQDVVVTLATNRDTRGDLTELFREEWPDAPCLCQWNAIRSGASAMRGMQVHAHHTDYLVVVDGEMLLALHDIRPLSASRGTSVLLRLSGDRLAAVRVDSGIVHGFYVPRRCVMVNGVTRAWSAGHELTCRWVDPALKFEWPDVVVDPTLSDRDRRAGSLAQLEAGYRAATA